jgi:hypothetical protein
MFQRKKVRELTIFSRRLFSHTQSDLKYPYAIQGFTFSNTGLISLLRHDTTDTDIYLLGTNHYHLTSASHVREAFERIRPDVLFAELTPQEVETFKKQNYFRHMVGHPRFQEEAKDFGPLSMHVALEMALKYRIPIVGGDCRDTISFSTLLFVRLAYIAASTRSYILRIFAAGQRILGKTPSLSGVHDVEEVCRVDSIPGMPTQRFVDTQDDARDSHMVSELLRLAVGNHKKRTSIVTRSSFPKVNVISCSNIPISFYLDTSIYYL